MDNQTIKDRVYLFCEYKKISIKQFESLCGMSNGYVAAMRKGFGMEKLNNVLKQFPEINREWLLFGEGEMLKSQTTTHSILGNNISNVQNGDNINSNAAVSELVNQLRVKDTQISKTQEQISKSQEQITKSQEQISKSQEQIDRLISLLEKK